MKRETLRKKNQLLRHISRDDYEYLLKYVEDIYLAKYQIKILMARKFSNLFFALLPLVKEEDGGRVQKLYQQAFPTPDKEPKIISNRALGIVHEEIKRKHCNSILLADDIIIHGRTLNSIYNQLEAWFAEAEISDYHIHISAYAESDQGLVADEHFLANKEVKLTCEQDEWRAISNTIVDIFYLLGQPYTSYVPNCHIDFWSEAGKRLSEYLLNHRDDFSVQTSAEMNVHGMTAYSYIEKETYNFSLNCSMRIYEYKKLEKYILVPMVMLKPIPEYTLHRYLQELDWMLTSSGRAVIEQVKDPLFLYQAVIYLLSALWGWKFSQSYLQLKKEMITYDAEEERMNFSCPILLPPGDIEENYAERFQNIAQHYHEDKQLNDDELYKEPGVRDLQEILQSLYHEISEKENPDLKQAIRAMMGRFLYQNGEMDEAKCLEEKNELKADTKQRLMGYPLGKMNALFQEIGKEWLRAVLYAIDFGKGSIVPKLFEEKNQSGDTENWYFSVLHAGEQNYKYFANTYFPFLYGLYCLEQIADEKKAFLEIHHWKEVFIKDYQKYWKEKGNFFFRDDMKLLQKMNITKDYKRVLDSIAWNYFADPDLDYAINLSKTITENVEKTCQ